MKPIRNSVKAILIEEGKLLVTRNKDVDGEFYLLPGGGQRPGETFLQALKRECLEEVGVRIVIEEILLIREYISAHHEFADTDGNVHQIEFMFRCALNDGERPRTGSVPDIWQTGIAWLPIDRLGEYRFYPTAIIEPLQRLSRGEKVGSCYLGDVN
jgi:8-oxo-dGTP pyrophosphatase MutT (NUDIX family)